MNSLRPNYHRFCTSSATFAWRNDRVATAFAEKLNFTFFLIHLYLESLIMKEWRLRRSLGPRYRWRATLIVQMLISRARKRFAPDSLFFSLALSLSRISFRPIVFHSSLAGRKTRSRHPVVERSFSFNKVIHPTQYLNPLITHQSIALHLIYDPLRSRCVLSFPVTTTRCPCNDLIFPLLCIDK